MNGATVATIPHRPGRAMVQLLQHHVPQVLLLADVTATTVMQRYVQIRSEMGAYRDVAGYD